MNRRNFIALATASAASGIIVPKVAIASAPSMAGGLYYTLDAPGRWAKKAKGHAPMVTIKGSSVEVLTRHGFKGYDHYIIKHIILDQEYQFITENLFNPTEWKTHPKSNFSLGGYKGRIHVLSVCNLHDTWMSTAEVYITKSSRVGISPSI